MSILALLVVLRVELGGEPLQELILSTGLSIVYPHRNKRTLTLKEMIKPIRLS
jgi:hypothetical protein